MINNKETLRGFLLAECPLLMKPWYRRLFAILSHSHEYTMQRYKYYLRKSEYHYNTSFHQTKKKGNLIHDLWYIWYCRKKNILEEKLGIKIGINTIDKGLKIAHYGFIAVNMNTKAGENLVLHGSNCIGNKGEYTKDAPVIGNNVEFGIGAAAYGNIHIADNVIIGAGCIVTKDIPEKGAVVVGNPMRILRVNTQ